MYILYDYDVFSQIEKSMDEADIVEAMSVLIQKNIGQRFLIQHINEQTNIPETTSIKNVRDYYNYVLDYNERLKNMSCVELKESILERNQKTLKRKK